MGQALLPSLAQLRRRLRDWPLSPARPTWNISLCMCPIICSPPAASTRGAKFEGPGPSRSRLGMDRGLSRAFGGGTSSWWEAMVRTRPAAWGPSAAVALTSARNMSQGTSSWCLEARPVDGLPLELWTFVVCRGDLTRYRRLSRMSGPDRRGVEPLLGRRSLRSPVNEKQSLAHCPLPSPPPPQLLSAVRCPAPAKCILPGSGDPKGFF